MARLSPVIKIARHISEFCVTCFRMFIVKLLLLFGPQKLIERVAKRGHKRYNFPSNGPVGPAEAMESFATLAALKARCENIYFELIHNPLTTGDDVPNVPLILLGKGGTTSSCHLKDFMKAGRPLVLNFGSCT